MTPNKKIGEGKTVLLANDDEFLLSSGLRNKIEELGCEVVLCEDMNGVLQALGSNKIDILVLDNNMPTGGDWGTRPIDEAASLYGAGMALVEHIRAGEAGKHYADTPIIIASGQLERASHERLLTMENVWAVLWGDANQYVEEILQGMAKNKKTVPVVKESKLDPEAQALLDKAKLMQRNPGKYEHEKHIDDDAENMRHLKAVQKSLDEKPKGRA